jgi:arabinogalactan endo-1,4-beta-galactosidase
LWPSVSAKASGDFAYGADVGWLAQMEANGITWKNDDGVTQDPLEILQDHGVDSVRLRVFVNPPASAVWQKTSTETCYLGYADTASVIAMAQRADNLGMRIMVDFHYSDHFADPAYQDIPAVWSGHNYSQLCTDVYNFTYNVMTQLEEAGITPEWAQVGNEINSGILLPYGSSGSNFSQLAGLLNSGYNAVKAVSSSTKVVTHLANGYDNGTFRWFFDNFLNTYNGLTDVIGMSYYPYWIGTPYTSSIGDLTDNLEDMASRYGKEVMVVEVGGSEDDPQATYNTLMAVMNAVKGVPGNMGAGVFYWEPEANSAVLPDGYPLGATTQLSGNVLQFTWAIDAFADNQIFPDEYATYKIVNRNSGKALNIAGGSSADGAVVEQYGYDGWSSQKFRIQDAGGGYYKIINVNSDKALDIDSLSTTDGAACIQWTYGSGWNQQWSIVADGGYYHIINRNSGKYLDMEASSTADGGACIQWTGNGGWNQDWMIVAVD